MKSATTQRSCHKSRRDSFMNGLEGKVRRQDMPKHDPQLEMQKLAEELRRNQLNTMNHKILQLRRQRIGKMIH